MEGAHERAENDHELFAPQCGNQVELDTGLTGLRTEAQESGGWGHPKERLGAQEI